MFVHGNIPYQESASYTLVYVHGDHHVHAQHVPEAPGDDADDNDDVDRHGGACVGYGIAVVCVTIFVFCVLVSSSFSVWKACASAALTALLLIVAGCFAPKRWFHRSQPGASAELVVTVTDSGAARPGFPCPQVNVPPAFAFECPLALEAGGGGEHEPAATAASCVVCSVCLEDVRGGEMVRQLPACMHLFHVGCIDMWLHSHRTCPRCRCVISPVAAVTPKASAEEEAPESSDDDHDLPPV